MLRLRDGQPLCRGKHMPSQSAPLALLAPSAASVPADVARAAALAQGSPRDGAHWCEGAPSLLPCPSAGAGWDSCRLAARSCGQLAGTAGASQLASLCTSLPPVPQPPPLPPCPAALP